MRSPLAWLLPLAFSASLLAAGGASAGEPSHGRPSMRSRESCASRCLSRFAFGLQQRSCIAKCTTYTGMAYFAGRSRRGQGSCYQSLVLSSDRALCRDRIARKRYPPSRY